jgi:uncharacterized protein YjbJ (UPF0337 family)
MGFDDKVKNKANQAGGKVKEVVGKLTDDPQMELDGRMQNAGATMAEGAENVKDSVKRGARHLKDALK